MSNWIENIAEPRRLILAWQAPDHMGDRFRWAVACLQQQEESWAFEYLRPGSDFERLNQGRTYAELEALGFQGYPAFSRKRRTHEGDSISVFMRRLPPQSRSDFEDYCHQFRIKATGNLSKISLLGLTEAKLPSDGFSLVDPLDGKAERCDLMLEIAGFRYYAESTQEVLQTGMPVDLVPEPDNPNDPDAIKICIANRTLGYINRLQTKAFHQWIREGRVTAVLERLNGNVERPRAFIFVRVRPVEKQVAA